MSILVKIIFFFIASQSLYAASTEARSFSLEFYVPEDQIQVHAQLIQSCRFEKWTIGDTARYEEKFKTHPLIVKESRESSTKLIQISLQQTKRLEVRGLFKPQKECMSQLKIMLNDKHYAIGWANQFKKPISFLLQTPSYDYREGDSLFEFDELREQLENRLIEFSYKSVPDLQVNIWLLIDGRTPPFILPKSAALNPKTLMPYRLRNQ